MTARASSIRLFLDLTAGLPPDAALTDLVLDLLARVATDKTFRLVPVTVGSHYAGVRRRLDADRPLLVVGEDRPPGLRPGDEFMTDLGEAPGGDAATVVYAPFAAPAAFLADAPSVVLFTRGQLDAASGTAENAHRSEMDEAAAAALRRAAKVQALSFYSRETLVAGQHIPPEKVFVTYPLPPAGVPAMPPATRETGAVHPSFVGVVDRWAGAETLLEGYAQYRRLVGEGAWALRVAGVSTEDVARFQAQTRSLGGDDEVFLVELVPPAVSAGEGSFDGASALVHLAEGDDLCLPILQAFARRLPVLAADAGSAPEVAGAGALYVDRRSPEDIARGLAEVSGSEGLRGELVQFGGLQLGRRNGQMEAGKLELAFREVAAGR